MGARGLPGGAASARRAYGDRAAPLRGLPRGVLGVDRGAQLGERHVEGADYGSDGRPCRRRAGKLQAGDCPERQVCAMREPFLREAASLAKTPHGGAERGVSVRDFGHRPQASQDKRSRSIRQRELRFNALCSSMVLCCPSLDTYGARDGG